MAHGRTPSSRALAALLLGLLGALIAWAMLTAPEANGKVAQAAGRTAGNDTLQAEIRRTAGGIPHILADDWDDLAFGYGYAFAKDNICTIAESYVTVGAQRSRYFGPDGSYLQRGNGFSANNLNSDFFYQRIIDEGVVEDLLAQPPPHGPVQEIREGVRGYVAGYNEYLADTGVENLPDPRCRGAEWVRPITEIDAWRRFYQLILLASSTIAIDGIATAQPPAPGETATPQPAEIADGLSRALEDGTLGGLGSNAYGLGSDATSNGRGIVLANPHFPWDGPERFYQSHLTIPGELNVSGMSLYGVPLILIGHTQGLAWSHTVSTAFRFTPFEETLVPGSPTTYLYDGQPRQMEKDTVTVTIGPGDERTRTLYSTHHGPVMTSLAGIPLPWVQGKAFTMGDVNAANFRALNHFFFTNQAQSVEELDEIERTYQGIPWVNTIAADSEGRAYYADIGAIPNVTNDKAADCNTALGATTFQGLRLPVLDGSRSACEWGDDPDSAAPGIFGPSNEPSLFRDDYVTNSNDSYWLSNPEEPLEGFARIIGDERTARTLRTRLGLKMLVERLDEQSPPAKLNRLDVQNIVFNNRQYAGELWRDRLVQLCEGAPGGMLLGSSGPVDVSEACPVLAAWDLHDDLDSNGAILFRRFATRVLAPIGGLVADPTIYTTPFDANDPVNTPAGLNTASPKVQQALADAVTDLRDAGVPLDAPLRGYQYEPRGGENIPIHGGPGTVGVFNAINVSSSAEAFRANRGWPDIPSGSSFVMVTQFTDGCPDDQSILTYSQSENPDSPYFADQTRLFSDKVWIDPPFCESEVLADPTLQTQTVKGKAPRR